MTQKISIPEQTLSHDHSEGNGAPITDANLSTTDIATNNASTSKHGFLKKLTNTITDFMNGQGNWVKVISAKQMLLGNGGGGNVPASTTNYINLAASGLTAAAGRNIVVSEACTVTNLQMIMGTAQPASGNMVVTVQKNNVDTAITFTIPANAAPATFSDTSNSVSFVAGDTLNIKLVNNATAPSGGITNAGLLFTFT